MLLLGVGIVTGPQIIPEKKVHEICTMVLKRTMVKGN
jgi:hypothetical protein